MKYKVYQKKATIKARPYIMEEDLTNISISPNDKPTVGGMIAHDPTNPSDQWYISPEYFVDNYEEVK